MAALLNALPVRLLTGISSPFATVIEQYSASFYLKNGGSLEKAAAMANHSSTRTTQLYDRRHDEMTLDEVEKIGI
ncbi:hypothetical protein [Nitrosovibrio tenuis]|uniref:Phage integrase family protein n=1 Tax=Nitrosovibrio tenuis TaxID=1233 RepID=A0A1H7RTP1_9PROT|nr:hypothetical protein [Nitrosovibrio tenuis]SEL63563.1 hypothetical protein SAMN05216387_1205 [Nitrosovibrio tenuis]